MKKILLFLIITNVALGSIFSQQTNNIVKFEGPQFIGREIFVDSDFIASVEQIEKYAKQCNVQLYITSSFRDAKVEIVGNIVPQSKISNHFVGHAIDFNVMSGEILYNSKKLIQLEWLKENAEPVYNFLQLVRADPNIRWGGDFSTPDSVHLDDALNLRDKTKYDALFLLHQTKKASEEEIKQ